MSKLSQKKYIIKILRFQHKIYISKMRKYNILIYSKCVKCFVSDATVKILEKMEGDRYRKFINARIVIALLHNMMEEVPSKKQEKELPY